jgi:hypothetical protein
MLTSTLGAARRGSMVIAFVMLAWWTTAAPARNVSRLQDRAEPQQAQKQITFEMQNTPWATVLEWLVDQAGLPLIGDCKPTGSFTHTSPRNGPRSYTLPQVIAILNEALVEQNLMLVRRKHCLAVVALDMIEDDYAVFSYTCRHAKAKEAIRVLQELLGDPRRTLGKAGPNFRLSGGRQSRLVVPADPLYRITTDDRTNMVLMTAPADLVARARKILKLIDVPVASQQPTNTARTVDQLRSLARELDAALKQIRQLEHQLTAMAPINSDIVCADNPVFRQHRIGRGDAMIVAKRLQQAYSRDPGVRITVVGGDSILVYAIPDVQEAVEKVLKR